MKTILSVLILALLAGCASQSHYSAPTYSKHYVEEAEYDEEEQAPTYRTLSNRYSRAPAHEASPYQRNQAREETPPTPVYANAKPNLVCAEQWVSCGVQPVGSIIQATQRRQLYSFWKTACACGEACGCIDDLANGEGFARWCDSTNGCSGSDLYGAASGRVNNGRFTAINGRLLVTINTPKGLFHGEIHSDGTYRSGIMEQVGQDEKFIGLFNPDGSYQSGALYSQGRVILANQFSGKTPLGRVLIGDGSGNFIEQECDQSGCHIVQQDNSPFISDLFAALSQNAAQDIAIRGILTALGKEALLMHPAFRGFAFLQNVFDVVALANKASL